PSHCYPHQFPRLRHPRHAPLAWSAAVGSAPLKFRRGPHARGADALGEFLCESRAHYPSSVVLSFTTRFVSRDHAHAWCTTVSGFSSAMTNTAGHALSSLTLPRIAHQRCGLHPRGVGHEIM